jgi:6-phosphogluconolactonase
MEFKGQFGGGLSAFKYDVTNNRFEKQNEMLIPYGGPCYISMSPDSGYLFIANYPNGSVAVVRLDNNGVPETITDTILYNKEEPDASHAHMILNDQAGKHI